MDTHAEEPQPYSCLIFRVKWCGSEPWWV